MKRRNASLFSAVAALVFALVATFGGAARAGDEPQGYVGTPVASDAEALEGPAKSMAKRASAPSWEKVVVPVSNPADATDLANVRVVFNAERLDGRIRTVKRDFRHLRPGTSGNAILKLPTRWYGQNTDVPYRVVRLDRTLVEVWPDVYKAKYVEGSEIFSGIITASGGVIVRADPVNVGGGTSPDTTYPNGNVVLFNQVTGKYLVGAAFNGSGYTFPNVATGSWGAVPFTGNAAVIASFADVPNGAVTGTATMNINGPVNDSAPAVVWTITSVTPIQQTVYPNGSIVLLNSVPGNKFLVSASFNSAGYTFPNIPTGSWGYVTGFTGTVAITARFADVAGGPITGTATQTVTAPASSSAPAVVWEITTIAQP